MLNDAEEDLREWTPTLEPIPSSATELGPDLMPASSEAQGGSSPAHQGAITGGEMSSQAGQPVSPYARDVSGSSTVAQPEPTTSYQR